MNFIEMIIETAKETTKEMILAGTSSKEVFNSLANKFDNTTARMIMVDIALDLGKEKEAKEYLASF